MTLGSKFSGELPWVILFINTAESAISVNAFLGNLTHKYYKLPRVQWPYNFWILQTIIFSNKFKVLTVNSTLPSKYI